MTTFFKMTATSTNTAKDHTSDAVRESPSWLGRSGDVATAVFPWTIIAALLWVALFVKPQPLGETIQPPVIELRDRFYGISVPAAGALWLAGNDGKVVRSDDNGVTWRLQETPIKTHLQSIAAWSNKQAVAVGNGGDIIITSDGGNNWIEVAPPRSEIANKLIKVVALPSGEAWAVGELGMILQSRDYGRTWQRRREEQDIILSDIAIVDDDNIWIVCEFGLMLRSRDGGTHWEEIQSEVESSLTAIDFRDSVHGVAVGLDGVILTTNDGGDTWLRAGLSILYRNTEAVLPTEPTPPVWHDFVSDHLFDIAWNDQGQEWLAVGNKGIWLRGEVGATHWESGRVAPRDMSWHTDIAVIDDHVYFAGDNVGRWSKYGWRVFSNKNKEAAVVN